jgi:ATP-dependent protease ClpP protease subunit
MSKQFLMTDWAAMRARVAAAIARGECDYTDGRAQLASIDAYLAKVQQPVVRTDGAFYYARPAAETRAGYFAFLNRFASTRRAATDIGGGGLVTETEGVTELCVYGAIGAGFGIGPADVARALDEHAIERVRLNSPGGDVFDGIAIANLVAQAKLPVIVDGVAASIASVIAASSPHVTMMAGAFLMAHKSWSAPIGNGDDLRKEAAVLDKLDDTMANIYARKSARSKVTVAAWLARMKAETWFTADEAVAAGLADVHDDEHAGDLAQARTFDMAAYHARVPSALRMDAAA